MYDTECITAGGGCRSTGVGGHSTNPMSSSDAFASKLVVKGSPKNHFTICYLEWKFPKDRQTLVQHANTCKTCNTSNISFAAVRYLSWKACVISVGKNFLILILILVSGHFFWQVSALISTDTWLLILGIRSDSWSIRPDTRVSEQVSGEVSGFFLTFKMEWRCSWIAQTSPYFGKSERFMHE